ncbi:hypothetical protein QCA50_015393 [Cerrena zonata]|uniref:RTA1-like protein n=1 Tax=Cerrena zonata TaxID=2478898 RepID=A0AAW0FPZ7_9APHY
MTTSIASYLLFLLASAYSTLAAPSDFSSDVTQLFSRKYDNPDPSNDPENFFGYIPMTRYTIMALVAFISIAIAQTYMVIRYKGYYMLAMLIAEFTFTAGIALRIPLHDDPTKLGLYVAENSLIVLSPVGFIAANYVLLGRLSRWLKCNNYMLIRPERITIFFVASDVITFFVQAAGGGISASGDASKGKLGARIFLVGLILQAVSFLFFTVMYIQFLYRVRSNDPRIWSRDAGKGILNDWRALAAALFASCIFILIRSVYRIAELSQGYRGSIAKNEAIFYLFDVLMLFHAVMVYTPFWPGRFIPDKKEMERQAAEEHYKESPTTIATLPPSVQGSHIQLDHMGRPLV